MTVYLIGGGPGDPGLVTVRGAALLGRADVVMYDRLSAEALLDLAPPHAERVGVGKAPGHPSNPQEEINAMLVEYGKAGKTVVRLKGGDPFVFGRGGEEAQALADAGIPFEIVPGVPALAAVPAYAGVPVTHRGLAKSLTIVTGQSAPWASPETDWDAVARVGGTIVVYMAVAVRGEVAARLMEAGLPADTPVAATTWGTVPRQRTIRTTLAGLGDAPVADPAIIVIGAVAALDLSWYESRPLFGRHVVVTRAAEQAGGLAERLTDLGAQVLHVPTISVVDAADGGAGLRHAASRAGTYDWIVFTSANAVTRLFAEVHDARSVAPARVAAVGSATAAALASRGIVADLVPDEFAADALVKAFPAGSGRVLLPQAAGGRDNLEAGLAAKGWSVERVEAYRTAPQPLDASAVAEASSADAITFTSPSTVEAWLAAASVHSTPPVVACIGTVTANAARRSGLDVTVVPDVQTADGLVDALVSLLGRHS